MSIKLEVLETYLNGAKEYEQGLQIYIRYGKNEALKNILSFGATAYNHKKLIDALRVMLEEAAPRGSAPRGNAQASPSPAANQSPAGCRPAWIRPGGKTGKPKGKQIFKVSPNHPELVKLYRERSFLKNQIPLLGKELDRMNAAFRILYISEEIERILFTGLPGQYLSKDRAELVNKHENNRKYISKYKGAPEKVDEVKRRQIENQAIQTTLQSDGK